MSLIDRRAPSALCATARTSGASSAHSVMRMHLASGNRESARATCSAGESMKASALAAGNAARRSSLHVDALHWTKLISRARSNTGSASGA